MSGRPTHAPKRWLFHAVALSWFVQGAAPAAQAGGEPGAPGPPAAEPPSAATPNQPTATAPNLPTAAPNQPISLEEAIQIAHQNHARVAVAEESVEAARQRVRQVRTGTLPSVTGTLGYQGRGTSGLGGLFGGNPTQTIPGRPGQPGQPGTPDRRVSINTDTTTFDQGLQPRFALTFSPYDGGLTRTQVRQARAGVETNLANLTAVRNNQAFEVTSNYLFQLQSERLLELRRVQEELAAAQLRRVEARVREGAAAEADRALPLSEFRNRQVDRITAQNDARVAANALRNSMGLPVGPALQLVELRENQEPPPPLTALTDVALRQRPEVVQAEAQVRVAQANVSIARISRRPRLDTSFGFNVSPNNPLQRSDFAVGAAVSLPLFDAGLTHAREQEARTGVQSSSAQLEQTRRDVTAEVVEAYLNLVNARERLEASRLAVEAAQVNLEQTTARYERGLAQITVVDLIQAQVQFANASNNAIQALYDIHLAQAQLNRAIGR